MTKEVIKVDLREIKRIRFYCTHCSAVVEVPTEAKSSVGFHCPNCHRTYHEKYLEALELLKRSLVLVNNLQEYGQTDVVIETLIER